MRHAISKAIVEQIYNRTHPNIIIDQQNVVDALMMVNLHENDDGRRESIKSDINSNACNEESYDEA